MLELTASEALVRLVAFVAIFGTMALVELASPRLERPELAGALKARRWFTNLAVVVISSLTLRLVFPAAAVGAAIYAEARGLGLFRLLGIPSALSGIASFVILDFAVWLEHVASHKLPLLWRIHRMHHADTGVDVTTGLRFHPLEILVSMIWKAGIVIALGAPVLSVLLFEIVLNGSAMFSHANIRLNPRLDAALRRVVVTPDMHRVHHSTDRRETDSNYGFNFSFWDRLFRTYLAAPARGHDGVEIGLAAHRGPETASLLWSLWQPFRRDGNRRQKKLIGK